MCNKGGNKVLSASLLLLQPLLCIIEKVGGEHEIV